MGGTRTWQIWTSDLARCAWRSGGRWQSPPRLERPIDADLVGRALEFVQTLPDQQRDAVLFRTTEGLSYKEIAEMLGTSEGSARVSYHHGVSKLRAHMAPLIDTSPTPEGVRLRIDGDE